MPQVRDTIAVRDEVFDQGQVGLCWWSGSSSGVTFWGPSGVNGIFDGGFDFPVGDRSATVFESGPNEFFDLACGHVGVKISRNLEQPGMNSTAGDGWIINQVLEEGREFLQGC